MSGGIFCLSDIVQNIEPLFFTDIEMSVINVNVLFLSNSQLRHRVLAEVFGCQS